MSSRDFLAWRLDGSPSGDVFSETPERVVEEGPLSVRVNDKPFTVTLRTPGDDRALVLGLLFSEGLVDAPEDVLALREEPPAADGASTWTASVKPRDTLGSKLSNRSLASTSSCGFCGKTAWEEDAACEAPAAPESGAPALTTGFLEACFRAMREKQDLFGDTGGSHAAAVFSADGRLLAFGEDAGRHNAVDKATGRLFERGLLRAQGAAGAASPSVLCVSGRVSYEIASKARRAGYTVLAAVSAPSSMAVEYCREHDLTLIGFCRGARATVYAHPERVGALRTETP